MNFKLDTRSERELLEAVVLAGGIGAGIRSHRGENRLPDGTDLQFPETQSRVVEPVATSTAMPGVYPPCEITGASNWAWEYQLQSASLVMRCRW